MPCYYQKAKTPLANDPLKGKWLCCGGVKEDGTPAEIENNIQFYLEYYAKRDTRGDHLTNGEYDVIITSGFHGNVAGRDGVPIKDTDIIRRRKRPYTRRGV